MVSERAIIINDCFTERYTSLQITICLKVKVLRFIEHGREQLSIKSYSKDLAPFCTFKLLK